MNAFSTRVFYCRRFGSRAEFVRAKPTLKEFLEARDAAIEREAAELRRWLNVMPIMEELCPPR